MRRFPIDLYHINDYHGAVAPLHLLPRTIPCCLSLHNAEFQGTFDYDRFQSRRHMRDTLTFHLLMLPYEPRACRQDTEDRF